jgi:putative membrane protein
VHSGLLGALLTFSTAPWYPDYIGRTEPWGMTALDDQQLGGVIMWVPACSLYIIAALVLCARWLRNAASDADPAAGRPRPDDLAAAGSLPRRGVAP